MTNPIAKPSVLFLSHSGGLSGAPIVLFEILNYLETLGCLQLAASFMDGGPLIDLLDSSIRLVPWQALVQAGCNENLKVSTRIKRKLQSLLSEKEILEETMRPHFDLVYANTILCGAKALELNKRHSIPYILHIHEMYYWLKKSNLPNLPQVLAEASSIIVPSSSAASDVFAIAGIGSLAVDIIGAISSNSIATKSPRQADELNIMSFIQSGRSDCTNVCLAVGSETWRKGKDHFIAVAGWAKRMRPDYDWRFLWIGGSPTEEECIQLEIEMRRYGCQDSISWFQQSTDIESVMQASDFFLLTSRDDPQPLVALEAFKSGLPLLCFSSCGGISELLSDTPEQVIPYADCQLMARRLIDFADRGRSGLRDIILKQKEIAQSHLPEVILPAIANIIMKNLSWKQNNN